MSESLLDLQALDQELLELEAKRTATSKMDVRILDLHRHRREVERQIQRTLEEWRRSLLRVGA